MSNFFIAIYALGAIITAILFWREMAPWAKVGALSGDGFVYIKLVIMMAVGAVIWPVTLPIILFSKD